MVLVPEVIKAIKPIRDVPVLAAGGIMTGRQMAACMAMGAAGVWTGSVWLATVESEASEIFREKMIAASSRMLSARKAVPESRRGNCGRSGPTRGTARPTVPARCRCRCRASSAATPSTRSIAPRPAGNARARDLVSYFVGQGVGLIDSVKSAGAVVQEFKEDFAEAVEHVNALVGE